MDSPADVSTDDVDVHDDDPDDESSSLLLLVTLLRLAPVVDAFVSVTSPRK